MKASSHIKLVNKYITRCFLLVVLSSNAVPCVVTWFCFVLFCFFTAITTKLMNMLIIATVSS